MDAIDKYSGLRPFTANERDALSHKPIGGTPPAELWASRVEKDVQGVRTRWVYHHPPRGARRMGLLSYRRGSKRIGSKQPQDGAGAVT